MGPGYPKVRDGPSGVVKMDSRGIPEVPVMSFYQVCLIDTVTTAPALVIDHPVTRVSGSVASLRH